VISCCIFGLRDTLRARLASFALTSTMLANRFNPASCFLSGMLTS